MERRGEEMKEERNVKRSTRQMEEEGNCCSNFPVVSSPRRSCIFSLQPKNLLNLLQHRFAVYDVVICVIILAKIVAGILFRGQ